MEIRKAAVKPKAGRISVRSDIGSGMSHTGSPPPQHTYLDNVEKERVTYRTADDSACLEVNGMGRLLSLSFPKEVHHGGITV